MLLTMPRAFGVGLLLIGATAACSDAEEPPPPPPTVVLFRAVDAVTDAPVAGAWIYAEAARTWQATGDDGTLSVEIDPGDTTYRVVAAQHAMEPAPLDELAIVGAAANQTTEVRVVLDPQTGGGPTGTIRGTVTVNGTPTEGVLVVAVGVASFASYTDATGGYVIPGVGSGNFTVHARIGGAVGAPQANVAVGDGTTDGIDFALTSGGVEVSGAITGGTGTGLVALLDPAVRRRVPGLVATAPLDGRYAIDGVAPGTYLVLGAYDEDAYVMDPEPIRTGDLPEITVDAADVAEDFAVAPAIDGLAPTGTATATPTLEWAPVTGADYYVVDVRDAAGRTVWGGFDAAGRWSTRVLGATSVVYGGPALSPGARYAFRVFAAVQDPVIPSAFSLIAASEARGASFRVAR